MKCNNKVKHYKSIFKTLEWITYLGLLLGSGQFIIKVWYAFQSEETSIKHFSKQWQEMIPPKVIFCFNPLLKTSVLEKYNITLSDLMGNIEFESNSTIFEEGFYQLEKDFNVEIKHLTYGQIINKSVNIEEVYTFYNGKCFKINPETKIKKMEYLSIKILTSKDLLEGDIPKANFYVMSEHNSNDIITDQWVSGKQPIQFEIDLNEKISTDINLQMYEYMRLDMVSNCTLEPNPVVCGAKKLVKIKTIIKV